MHFLTGQLLGVDWAFRRSSQPFKRSLSHALMNFGSLACEIIAAWNGRRQWWLIFFVYYTFMYLYYVLNILLYYVLSYVLNKLLMKISCQVNLKISYGFYDSNKTIMINIIQVWFNVHVQQHYIYLSGPCSSSARELNYYYFLNNKLLN